MIVLDSNVVSELMKPAPEPAVREWVRSRSGRELYTTTITLAEVGYGIERLPAGRRRDLLRSTAARLFAQFDDQVLPFDTAAAAQYPLIVTRREHAGRPIDGFDAQIAAVCATHGATLATRNIKDFETTGITVFDPWHPGPTP